MACFVVTRFSAGQEGGCQPAQESGELQDPHRQHSHGHRQSQGSHTSCFRSLY